MNRRGPPLLVWVVVGLVLLYFFGGPLLNLISSTPPAAFPTPRPANEATRVAAVATTGIPDKPDDVWVIPSVAIFSGNVAIEGGTLAVANIPVEGVLKAKIPPTWVGGLDIDFGSVTKGLEADGYIVPGFQVTDGNGNIQIEMIGDPKANTLTIRPANPMVILHAYVPLDSLRWTQSEHSTLAFSVDDTQLVKYLGDQMQAKLNDIACTTTVKDSSGNPILVDNKPATALEAGRVNVEKFLSGIISAAYDKLQADVQKTSPETHVRKPTIIFEWPQAPCRVLPPPRPAAPGAPSP